MLDSLLEQLLLTIHCLESDDSLPQATENDILHLTLKHSAEQLPEQTETLKQHILLILNSLFPQDQQRAQLNIKRGNYGIRSLISYLNTIKSHPAYEDQLLEPHLKRILKLLIENQQQESIQSLPSPASPPQEEQNPTETTDPEPSDPSTQQQQETQHTQPSTTTKKRNSTTVAYKLEVIDYHNQNKATQKQTATRFGLTQSQLSRWLKEEEELREHVLDKGSSSKRQRTGDFPQIEETLLRYFIEAKARNYIPSDEILKERTKSFMKLYQISEKVLKVSNGWLLRFKARNNIKSYQLPPPSSFSLDVETRLDSLREQLRNLTNSYALKDIYTLGEVELFCNLGALTGSLDVNPSERLRLTYLLCTNADGSDKRTPLVIGRCSQPETFQAPLGERPYWYRYSTRGRTSSPIFSEWMRKFDRDMQRQQRRVLLLIDNPQGHVCELESLVSTVVTPLPTSTIRFVQPLRAGIIRTFKSNYRRNLLEFHTQMLQQEPSVAVVAQKKHEQRLALECAHSAWDQVTATTIRNCFAHPGIISARLEDGISMALDQNPASNHANQFASDLDMEESLMATQSALIQLQRDLNLPESSQLGIEDFLELENTQDQEGSCDQPELLPTDEDLVQESKFLSNQLLEEAQYRKQEEANAAEGLAAGGSSSSSLIQHVMKETSKSPKRAVKPRPRRKVGKRRSTSPPEGEEKRGQTDQAGRAARLGSTTHSEEASVDSCRKHAVQEQSSVPVPLSVQEMILNLDRLEYSLPFYLSPSLSAPPSLPHPSSPPSLHPASPMHPLDQPTFPETTFPHHDSLDRHELRPSSTDDAVNAGESSGPASTDQRTPPRVQTDSSLLFGLDSSLLLAQLSSTFSQQPSSSSQPVDPHLAQPADPALPQPHVPLQLDLNLAFIRNLKALLRLALTRPLSS